LDEQRTEHLKGCQNNSSDTLLFRVGFPAAICRTGKGGTALSYILESTVTGCTGSNITLDQLYLKHLGSSLPPLLHTKNQNAKSLGPDYRKRVEPKVAAIGQAA